MENKYFDFHNHTTYSDGISPPEVIIKNAKLNKLDYVAITDHDKVDGVKEAIRMGKLWDIEVIPGIEISTTKYHILGLNIDYRNKNFQEFVRYSALEQEQVCNARIKMLNYRGIPMTLEKIKNYFPKSRLGRINLFMAILQDRECKEFFEKKKMKIDYEKYKSLILTKKGKEIVDKFTTITPERAIKEIHAVGGLAFIAHPFKEIEKMEEMDRLVNYDIDGLEIQPRVNGKNERFRQYAREKNLLVTYGSDFHGGISGRQMLSREENIISRELEERLSVN